MKIEFIQEPELEFGAGRHIDIRFGLANFGPLDVNQESAPKIIRIGVVGVPETIEGVINWIEKCKSGIPAKTSPRFNLFPSFPGFTSDSIFQSQIAIDARDQREIPTRLLRTQHGHRTYLEELENAVQLFTHELAYLVDNSTIDVLLCAPPDFLDRGAQASEPETEDKSAFDKDAGNVPTFHDLLKANAMELHKPLQLIFPATYGKHSSLKRVRPLQDEATRAWNFHTALYYKAGGRPWRLIRSATDLTTCFVGISFYKSPDQAIMLTSMAQVFNERGHGVIVRGAPVAVSKEDRQPHLSSQDAYNLLSTALSHYRSEHQNLPARVVLHKTSGFSVDETEGLIGAISDKEIHSFDLINISRSFTRLFRAGVYPPLRGTVWTTEKGPHFVYTRGSVEFYSTYPGLYVPRTTQYQLEQGDSTPNAVAKEILELTKMNWNSTHYDNADPITIRAARQVGSILRYLDTNAKVEHRYSYYM
jgi:hypothetical protein